MGADRRKHVLTEAIEAVTKDRNVAYGEAEDHMALVATYWNTYLASVGHRPLQGHDIGSLMILMKVARVTTSPAKEDHWIDIAGYAACGFDCIADQQPLIDHLTDRRDGRRNIGDGASYEDHRRGEPGY